MSSARVAKVYVCMSSFLIIINVIIITQVNKITNMNNNYVKKEKKSTLKIFESEN